MTFEQISTEFEGMSAQDILAHLDNVVKECEFYFDYSKKLPRKKKKQWRKEIDQAFGDIVMIRVAIITHLTNLRCNTSLEDFEEQQTLLKQNRKDNVY